MKQLPLPDHYDVNKLFPVGNQAYLKYYDLQLAGKGWAEQHGVLPAAQDKVKVCLMPIDMQLTFCDPNAGLPVTGAMEDCQRAAEFIYRECGNITHIAPTFDTHFIMQIFHSLFLIDDEGNSPAPNTFVSEEDVTSGKWHINPAVASAIAKGNLMGLENHLAHYTKTLKTTGKEGLIIWNYHALLGGIGHALVPILEEAIRFHQFVRGVEIDARIKGGNPLTENYSVIKPNVLTGPKGEVIAQRNTAFMEKLLNFDMLVLMGEAKSHCFADSVQDILDEIMVRDRSLAEKIYLVEDCTSPVVIIPGDPNLDFTEKANEAFDRFQAAGMHSVKSTTPMWEWPDSKVPQPSQVANTVSVVN